MKIFNHIVTALLIVNFMACNKAEKKEQITLKDYTEATDKKDTSIERGKYLVTLMDCNTCHTPMKMTDQGPQPDMSRMLSGYPSDRPIPDFDADMVSKGVFVPHPDLAAFMGPWGISFAANLTPHETGMGSWSLEQFSKAMREGKFKGLDGSRTLFPPMPWMSYASLTDADLEAIFNYLKSIPAIDNVVPNHVSPTAK